MSFLEAIGDFVRIQLGFEMAGLLEFQKINDDWASKLEGEDRGSLHTTRVLGYRAAQVRMAGLSLARKSQ